MKFPFVLYYFWQLLYIANLAVAEIGFFADRSEQKLFIISSCLIKCADGVVGKNAVFRNEGGRDAVCVFVKKAVVANAKSDYNIEVSLLLVEELCLHDRVAHYLARYTGVFLGNSDVGLVHRADFTSDAVNFKAVELQDPCKDAAFFDKTNAGRNADLLCAYLVGKLDYLFNSGIFSVEAALDFGGGDSDLAVCAVFM